MIKCSVLPHFLIFQKKSILKKCLKNLSLKLKNLFIYTISSTYYFKYHLYFLKVDKSEEQEQNEKKQELVVSLILMFIITRK